MYDRLGPETEIRWRNAIGELPTSTASGMCG